MSMIVFVLMVIIIPLSVLIVGLLVYKSKKDSKPILYPDSFYEDLKYFKLDFDTVVAVMDDESEKIVFQATIPLARKHFNSVQKGFDDWIRNRQTSKSTWNTNKSTVTFS